MPIRIFIATLLYLSGALLPAQAAGAGRSAFVLGVMPYHSARVIINQHRPIVQFLREEVQPEVRLETSPSIRSFYDNAVRGDYDMVAIAAHLGRLLQVEHGFVPLVQQKSGGRCIIVVRKDSDLLQIAHLAGKRLATPDRLVMTSLVCIDLLEKYGLRAERDYQVQDMATFNSAVLAVERGDIPAAVTAPAALMQMRPEQRGNLRNLVDAAEFTSLVYMAHPRITPALQEKLRADLLTFSDAPPGRAFFAATGFGGFVPVSDETMRGMDVHLKETRRLLQQQPK